MGTRGRLEARITIPTGGWAAAIDDSGGGSAVAATVPAGTYYLLSPDAVGGGTLSLVDAFQAALNTAAPTDTITVSVSAGESGTGKTTITSTGSTSISWTSTELRDLLGFAANLSAGTSWTSPKQCQALWLPDCPYDARNALDGSWWGEPESDFAGAQNSAGYVWGFSGESCEVLEGLSWGAVSRNRAIQSNESTGNESWERFARQGIWGQAAWGTPTGPIRVYPDAGNNAQHGTYGVPDLREVKLAHFSDGFAAGSRRIQLPRLVRVPGSDSLITVPTDGPGAWYVPATAADFAQLGLAVPDFLWLCQDASGNAAAALGSVALVPNATGHLYQQTISGWTRKFLGTDGTSGQSWRTSDAALDLASGESFAMLALASFTLAVGSNRTIIAANGTNDRLQAAGTTATLRSNHNAVISTGVVDQSGLASVRQFCWYRNAALGQSGSISDTDEVVGTHNTSARTAQVRAIGNEGANPSLEARYGWVAVFKGANAERDWSAYLATLRG